MSNELLNHLCGNEDSTYFVRRWSRTLSKGLRLVRSTQSRTALETASSTLVGRGWNGVGRSDAVYHHAVDEASVVGCGGFTIGAGKTSSQKNDDFPLQTYRA